MDTSGNNSPIDEKAQRRSVVQELLNRQTLEATRLAKKII